MIEQKEISLKASDEPATQAADKNDSAKTIRSTRRDFMGFAFAAAASGLLLPELRSEEGLPQESGVACSAADHIGKELVSPGAIKGGTIVNGKSYLQGLVDLQVEKRALTFYNGNGGYSCQQHTLRAYQGYQGWTLDPAKRVTVVGTCSPGPTIRPSVGETVDLIFLNRIDPKKFAQTSVTSVFGTCDTANGQGGLGGPYPGADSTNFPNCFHASNTSNLHWHGTHTSPKAFADNVLLGIVPNVYLPSANMIQLCVSAFKSWSAGENPTAMQISQARTYLQQLKTMVNKQGNTDFGVQVAAAIQNNATNTKNGEFPQYWPGYFPYHFELPIWSGSLTKYPTMGQAPGTHWYHCHQHGSTALQLLNGMAGALIITDNSPTGYDGVLMRLGGGTVENPKIKEQVMVCQLFAEQPNQLNTTPSAATVAVNGQVAPTVTMAQGEVQLWRLIDAMMKVHGLENFLFLSSQTYQYYKTNPNLLKNGPPPSGTSQGGVVPKLYQTAQDGVQLDWKNFQPQLSNPQTTFNMAPGNRLDFLVQAPTTPSTSYLVFWPPTGVATSTFTTNGGPPPLTDIQNNVVLTVVVKDPPSGQNTQLPTQANQYPEQPKFLADIPQPLITRRIVFDMHRPKNPAVPPGKGAAGPGSQPFFYINGVQFSEGIINESMLMGDTEEWILENRSMTNIQHPFHIHINPFQVTEVYNPALMTPSGKTPDPARDAQKLPQPWVWWDTIPIPAGVQLMDQTQNPPKPAVDKDGNPIIVPGYIKMRSRFADFAGIYVFHCHILGHEDRGMMHMVQVVENHTVIKHH